MEPTSHEHLGGLLDQAEADPRDLGVLEAILGVLDDLEEDPLPLADAALELAAALVPEEVREGRVRLPWGWHENRPYLRLLGWRPHVEHRRGDREAALEAALALLRVEPDDAQGIREAAVGLALRLGRWEVALETAERFPGDFLPGTVYGRALALAELGRDAEAREAMREAVRRLPRVAEWLLDRDREPPERSPLGVSVGGDDQAYLYASAWGDLWSTGPAALELLEEARRTLRELPEPA